MKQAKQMSESIPLGVLLAIAGGLMDAYTYVCRDGVFANAQTGNIVLLGISLAGGQWGESLRYLFPILSFVLGIVSAELLRAYCQNRAGLHWRQTALVLEIAIFAAVGFIPAAQNKLANCLVSLACGIQVESFRKICGEPVATTMCIGNLRSATQALWDYWRTGEKEAASRAALYAGVILCFAVGAVLGYFCVMYTGRRAIWFCAPFLAAGFLLMRGGRGTGREAN